MTVGLLVTVLLVTVLHCVSAADTCPRDVADSIDSGSLAKCKDSVRTVGQTESKKLAGKTKIEVNDASLKLILDLPLKLAECVFKSEGLITGAATYTYKAGAFVDKVDLNTVVKNCKLSTPGVCPFKSLDSKDRLNCLPHPAPLMKCVRQAALKACSGSAPASSTEGGATPAATTAKADDDDEEDGESTRDLLDGMVGGDGGKATTAATGAQTTAAAAAAATTKKGEDSAAEDGGDDKAGDKADGDDKGADASAESKATTAAAAAAADDAASPDAPPSDAGGGDDSGGDA